MLGSKDIPLLRQGNMGINFRDIDRTVPQHFLNIADINILFQQKRSERVPEHVRCDMLVQICQSGIMIDHEADRLVG